MDASLVITADTHLPKRARDLPDQLWRAVDEADVLIFGHSHIPWDTRGSADIPPRGIVRAVVTPQVG
jgi:predicted phosphodiesterase